MRVSVRDSSASCFVCAPMCIWHMCRYLSLSCFTAAPIRYIGAVLLVTVRCEHLLLFKAINVAARLCLCVHFTKKPQAITQTSQAAVALHMNRKRDACRRIYGRGRPRAENSACAPPPPPPPPHVRFPTRLRDLTANTFAKQCVCVGIGTARARARLCGRGLGRCVYVFANVFVTFSPVNMFVACAPTKEVTYI